MKKTDLYILAGASITFSVALIVCFICDYFTSHGLSWSLVVLLSLTAAWLTVLVLLTAKGQVVQKLLMAVSTMVIPFLWLLSLLLHHPKIFSLGACIAVLSVAVVWSVYGLSMKYRGRIFLIAGLAFLISVPLALGISQLIVYFNGAAYADAASDIFHAVISLILAGLSFVMDYVVYHLGRR